jgi:DNA-binding SARP family transcriptional activator
MSRSQASRYPGVEVRLGLLDGFELTVDGVRIDVPFSAERVVAYLGLHVVPQLRSTVAGRLWPEYPRQRASANLRAAIWKLHDVKDLVVEPKSDRLGLARGVSNDVSALVHRGRHVLDRQTDSPGPALVAPAVLIEGLSSDVLPDWDEEWVVFERERVRQLRIHAMEALSGQLRDLGRHADAVQAGLAVVDADPLRESAQRALILAYLAEGNAVEARRQLRDYRERLWDDLAVRPSPALVEMVTGANVGDY